MIFRLFLFTLIFVGFGVPVQAEDAPEDQVYVSVNSRVMAITKDLDKNSERHFYTIYGSYNVIKVVEDIQAQVGAAVDKCIDANPDMKDALKDRFIAWEDALEPVIDEAEGNVDNMIAAQEYTKPRDIRKLLKFADEARAKKNEDLDKYPVTTPEACEYLRVKMDETQENLITLLESTLISFPRTMVNEIEEDEKAELEAAEETDAEHGHVHEHEADVKETESEEEADVEAEETESEDE